jgi:hypothetical protein
MQDLVSVWVLCNMYTFVTLVASWKYCLWKHPLHTLPLFEPLVLFERNSFYTLKPAKCQIRDVASDFKTNDMAVCCLVRAITHLGGWW